MLRVWTKARFALLAMALVCVGLMGAADPEAQFNKIGHEMICMCGCGQMLLECNHVGCPVSPVMIGELHEQVNKGGPDTLVMNWFAAKYGAVVLAAPMRGGFDNVAWVTPMAVFFFAIVGVGFMIVVWKKRRPVVAGASGGAVTVSDDVRAQIRRETEY